MPVDTYVNDDKQAKLTMVLLAMMAVISVALIVAAVLEA